jgi:Xaa-Pro aminopeptidase
MGLACSLIRKSKVKKGVLVLGGRSLTSGTIRAAIHKHFIDHGCTASDTIVSCGEDSAIPHITGSGPLYAGKPIVIDIFPKDERSGYYSDMTRTFSKEMPDADIADMYSAVSDARQMAAIQVREGAHGSEIHQAVVDFFKSRGYESSSTGFIHNLGHGVGLQVHEPPSLGPSGKDLVSGNVITIEPGLYYPGIGGVRIEDIGLVTKKGFRRFTKFPADLVL